MNIMNINMNISTKQHMHMHLDGFYFVVFSHSLLSRCYSTGQFHVCHRQVQQLKASLKQKSARRVKAKASDLIENVCQSAEFEVAQVENGILSCA